MKPFNALRKLALLLMIGAGSAYAADAAKPADASAKPAKAVKKAAKKDLPPIKVVYHLNEGNEQSSNALRNIKNHLQGDPTAKIAVVGHAKGIDFLLADAKDKNGSLYATTVDELAMQGVEFKVCNNTLVGRKIEASSVISSGKIVPAGVVEISRLQAREGYVYVKP